MKFYEVLGGSRKHQEALRGSRNTQVSLVFLQVLLGLSRFIRQEGEGIGCCIMAESLVESYGLSKSVFLQQMTFITILRLMEAMLRGLMRMASEQKLRHCSQSWSFHAWSPEAMYSCSVIFVFSRLEWFQFSVFGVQRQLNLLFYNKKISSKIHKILHFVTKMYKKSPFLAQEIGVLCKEKGK